MDALALLDEITARDSANDGRPAIGWPDPLLMALCRAHPERIPTELKVEIATSRGRVDLAPAAA